MILVLFGKSASGKDSILKEIVKTGKYKQVIPTTSRPIRANEVDGIDYNFITKEQFLQKIENNEFIEYRFYNTLYNGVPDVWYYGTEKQTFLPNNDYVCVVDVDGLNKLIEYFGRENIIVCYIEASDLIRKDRAKQRGTFSETEWNRRLKDDTIKFSDERIAGMDYYVINDDMTAHIIANDKLHIRKGIINGCRKDVKTIAKMILEKEIERNL